MKIENLRNETVTFSKIYSGNCFECNGRVYIKHHIYYNNGATNATNLASGETVLFSGEDNVVPINAKLVIED